jgi:predicted ABC-type sugar transport system permease subunit
MLASPLGPALAAVLLGGAALSGGIGGFVGGVGARAVRTARRLFG